MRLEPASLRRRTAAGVIDGALAIVVVIGLGGTVALYRRSTGRPEWSPARLEDPRIERGIAVATALGTFGLRHTRTPGSRAVGIRRLDARTGAPESLRAAVIRVGLSAALQQAIRRANAPHVKRQKVRRAELERRRQELGERFADDPAARKRAEAELGRASGENCLTAMIRPTALSALQPLTALLSPRRQTAIERLAGVAVVRDRG
jgi:uncharacterized RDD family membrane protein YckC